MMEPHPAATVMIARDATVGIDVFLLRRSSHSAFMPDVFVFPGGRVDAADRSPAALARIHGCVPNIDPACVVAAARETFEEAGLLFSTEPVAANALRQARDDLRAGTARFDRILSDLDVKIEAGALRYFSRWITPPGENRRFDTHFFAGRAPAGQIAAADASETHDGLWITPAAALTRYEAGDLALIFPTIKHLERLTAFTSVAALLAYAGAKTVRPVMPAAASGNGFALPLELEGVW